MCSDNSVVVCQAVIQFLCEVVRVLLLVVHAVYCAITRPMIQFYLDAINALVTAIEVRFV